MDANFMEYLETEEPTYVSVQHFYLMVFLVLAFGWVLGGVRFGQPVPENGLMVWPWPNVTLFLPLALPRMTGLVWLVALAVYEAVSEWRQPTKHDVTLGTLLFVTLAVILGGGAAAWLGAWRADVSTALFLILTVIISANGVRSSRGRDRQTVIEIALLVAAATGVWLGPLHGLWYGLVASVTMRLCPVPEAEASSPHVLSALHD